jgi:RNA polymerase sigma-70 factor (ECF subfamily)
MIQRLSDASTWPDQYGDHLFTIALYKTKNKETAEDLVQETFLSAFRSRNEFRGDSSEKTWLVTILTNKITDHYRKKDVLKKSNEYHMETESVFYNSFFNDQSGNAPGHWRQEAAPANWQTDVADKTLNTKEFFNTLQNCINKMPDRLAPVFVLKFMEEKKTDEICKELEVSPSNYWVMIHRAKFLIRRCLELNWFDKKSEK